MTLYAAPDILGNPQLETNFTEQLDGIVFKTFRLLEKHPFYGRAVPWELTITDFRGGYSQAGELTNDYAKTASSTLDYRNKHNLTLQLASVINTDTTIDNSPLASLPIFSTLALGAGATANLSLYSGSLTAANARTYSPGSNITCLHPIVIGGATSAVRLLVGRAGASPQVLADLGATPTVSGTMHANLNPTWGMLTSYLNASNPSTGTHLFYANGSIYTLPITAAIGDAPTVAGTASVYPNGGWAVDIIKWGGVDRAFWYMPQANRTTTVGLNPVGLTARGTAGRIIHTNLEGTDPQELRVKGLRDIVIAVPWRKGMFLSDEVNGYYVGDDEIRNLGFSRNWPIGSTGNMLNTIYGVWPHGDDLIVLYKRWLTTQLSTASFGTELYNWKLNTWQRTQGPTEPAGVSVPSGIGALPFSPGTVGTLHYTTISGAFTYQNVTQAVPRGGQSVFSLRTVGAEVGQSFETTGVWTSPLWTLPGLGGYPSVITEVDCTQVDLAAGGTGSIIKVEISSQPGTTQDFTGTIKPAIFDTNTQIKDRIKTYDTNLDAFNAFQVRITLTQGAAYKTPNGLPITIRGITFLDRMVVAPDQVRGKGWSR